MSVPHRRHGRFTGGFGAVADESPPPRRPMLGDSDARAPATDGPVRLSSSESSVLGMTQRSHTSPFSSYPSTRAASSQAQHSSHGHVTEHLATIFPLFAGRWSRVDLACLIGALRRIQNDAEAELAARFLLKWLLWATRRRAVRALYEAVTLPQCESIAHLYLARWWRWARERCLLRKLVAVRGDAEWRIAKRSFHRWLLWTLTPHLTTALHQRITVSRAARALHAWECFAFRRRQLRTLTTWTICTKALRQFSAWRLWAVRRRQSRELACENAVRHARFVWRRWLLAYRRDEQRRSADRLL